MSSAELNRRVTWTLGCTRPSCNWWLCAARRRSFKLPGGLLRGLGALLIRGKRTLLSFSCQVGFPCLIQHNWVAALAVLCPLTQWR